MDFCFYSYVTELFNRTTWCYNVNASILNIIIQWCVIAVRSVESKQFDQLNFIAMNTGEICTTFCKFYHMHIYILNLTHLCYIHHGVSFYFQVLWPEINFHVALKSLFSFTEEMNEWGGKILYSLSLKWDHNIRIFTCETKEEP